MAEETTTVPDSPSGFEGPALEKAATGIVGFDELTHGGLPWGRPTLVAGDAGSGKTLFGLEFLVRGASRFGEPGVLVSLEESHDDLCANVASLGLDLAGLEPPAIGPPGDREPVEERSFRGCGVLSVPINRRTGVDDARA